MKKLLIIALLLGSNLMAYDIHLDISNMKNHKGQILLALFDRDDSFPKPKVVYKEGVLQKIDKKVMHYTFKNIPKGIYAISLVHDANANGKMDTNFLGMPKEGYGVSNNPKNRFLPPSFKQCKFKLNKTVTLKIYIQYL